MPGPSQLRGTESAHAKIDRLTPRSGPLGVRAGIVAIVASAASEESPEAEIAVSTAAPTSSRDGVKARGSPGAEPIASRRPPILTVDDARPGGGPA